MYLVDVQATVATMAKDVIVAEQSKWFTFTGTSLTANDIMFFVPFGQMCSLSNASNSPVSMTDKVLESSTTLKVRMMFP